MSALLLDFRDESIQAQVSNWFQQFCHSLEFSGLSQFQRDLAEIVIHDFAHYSSTCLGVEPQNWNALTVELCCINVLPRKALAGRAFFNAATPVLRAFFAFLDTHGILPQAHSLAEAAERAHSDMLMNSENPARWGPAKSFAMAAARDGYDLTQPGALDAWCQQMNVRFLGQFATVGQSIPLFLES